MQSQGWGGDTHGCPAGDEDTKLDLFSPPVSLLGPHTASAPSENLLLSIPFPESLSFLREIVLTGQPQGSCLLGGFRSPRKLMHLGFIGQCAVRLFSVNHFLSI